MLVAGFPAQRPAPIAGSSRRRRASSASSSTRGRRRRPSSTRSSPTTGCTRSRCCSPTVTSTTRARCCRCARPATCRPTSTRRPRACSPTRGRAWACPTARRSRRGGLTFAEPDDVRDCSTDGSRLELAGLTCASTTRPGHTGGSVVFGARRRRRPAAVLRRPAVRRLHRPHRPARRLRARDGELARDASCCRRTSTVVLPGHGPSTTIGRERATNPYLRELPTSRTGSRAPKGVLEYLPPERGRVRRRRGARRAGAPSRPPGTATSRRRPSRTPSCSCAASASPPTS